MYARRNLIGICVAFLWFSTPFSSLQAVPKTVTGVIKSADPNTGAVVLETHDGEVTVNVTVKTKNWKLVQVGKSVAVKIDDNADGNVATSVSISNQKGAAAKAKGKQAEPKIVVDNGSLPNDAKYGVEPVMAGDAELRPDLNLLKSVVGINRSRLFRFDQTARAEIDRQDTFTNLTIEGRLSIDRAAWKEIANELSTAFAVRSTFKLPGLVAEGRAEAEKQ